MKIQFLTFLTSILIGLYPGTAAWDAGNRGLVADTVVEATSYDILP